MAETRDTTSPPAGNSRLRLFRQSTDLTATLARIVDSAKNGDPLAPVTVIGPTTYANLTIRRELARSGSANVRFMVLPRLAELLGSPALSDRGRRPLTSIIESATVRAVAGRANGVLSGLRSHPSTIRSIRSTFRQMRHATEEALDRLSSQDDLRREVAGLYRDFREQTRGYYDKEDLAQEAAAAVRDGRAAGLADLGLILFFQIRSMTPGERALVQALAESDACAVFLGLTGDPDADEPIEELAGLLSPFLGNAERQVPSGDDLPSARPAGGTRLLIAPGPHEEVRWVIRQLVYKAEQGTPFHRMAVLYGARTPYDTLVREELELAKIPVSGPNASPLVRTAVGRTLQGLLGLSGGEFKRHEVMDWLTGCPVRVPGNQEQGAFSPSNWDAISRKAGVVSGVPQWTDRLERYAAETQRSSVARERKGEISEAQAAQMMDEVRAARSLARFVSALESDLNPPEDAPDQGVSWEDYSDWARGLLDRYLVSPDRMPETEQAAFDKVHDLLAGVASAGEVQPPTLELFKETLDEALQESVGHSGVTGQGVFVGPIASAAAMNFDILHIVGMIEGAVPPHTGDDPLVPDRERQAAGGAAAGLPLRQGRLAEERYAFLSALTLAPEAVLSFPRADPAGQRAHYPSRWFMEQASVIEGSPVYTSSLASLVHRDWLTIIPSMDQSLLTVAEAAPADLHDYDVERLWRWKRSGQRALEHPLASSGILANSLALGRGRYGSGSLTVWDGNVSGAVQGTGFTKRLEESALSPTSLEQWAGCPFRYFMGQVLRIGALEDPEEVFSISPLDKGSLVHRILDEFITAVQDEGSLPRPGEPWSAHHRETLDRIARAGFQQAEEEGKTGRALMWRLEQEDILNDLHSFLEADTDLRERFGVSPTYSEARFGMGDDSWPAPELELDGSASIRFRGIIDRVDTNPAGKVLVMDYKTGGSTAYSGLKDDPIDRGKHLQLAVYSLAARNALGEDASVQAAYWFISSRGGFALMPGAPVDISDKDVQERFKEAVSVIVSGIKSGLFPANPGPADRGDFQNCRFCDFKPVCPSRKDTLWTRKKGHPQLAGYLELSGETTP